MTPPYTVNPPTKYQNYTALDFSPKKNLSLNSSPVRDSIKQKLFKPKLDRFSPSIVNHIFSKHNYPSQPQNFSNSALETALGVWKRRHKIPESAKIYSMTGNYPYMRIALGQRGWQQNKDAKTSLFNFKWALKAKDIDYDSLNSSQIVNHFEQNAAITTKIGLCHGLKKLIFYQSADIDDFFPKSFDLSDD